MWSPSHALAKTLDRKGASHHPAFMGKWLTIIHMFLALSTHWMSSPSKKRGRVISPRFHLVVLWILLWPKSRSARVASHHPAFMGRRPTISHAFLA